MDSVGRVAVEGRLFWMECGGLVEKGGGGGCKVLALALLFHRFLSPHPVKFSRPFSLQS